jgi:hypothetical protein
MNSSPDFEDFFRMLADDWGGWVGTMLCRVVHPQTQAPDCVYAFDGTQLAVRNSEVVGRRGELDAGAHRKTPHLLPKAGDALLSALIVGALRAILQLDCHPVYGASMLFTCGYAPFPMPVSFDARIAQHNKRVSLIGRDEEVKAAHRWLGAGRALSHERRQEARSAHKIIAFDEEACLQQAHEAMLKASLGSRPTIPGIFVRWN